MASSDSLFLTLPGSVAFSEFRCRGIAANTNAKAIRAQWVHYLHLAEPLQDNQPTNLEQLLRYGDIADSPGSFGPQDGKTLTYYVSPRVGTISPWSSQATGIAHVCGFQKCLKRIERGLRISCLVDEGVDSLDAASLDVLHDRMTQVISTEEPNLQAMFAEKAPAPLEVVSLKDGEKSPREILQGANKRLGLALDSSEIDYLVDAYAAGGLLSHMMIKI